MRGGRSDYVDIGIAVASPAGLVLPVIRNCEGMDLAQVLSPPSRASPTRALPPSLQLCPLRCNLHLAEADE